MGRQLGSGLVARGTARLRARARTRYINEVRPRVRYTRVRNINVVVVAVRWGEA